MLPIRMILPPPFMCSEAACMLDKCCSDINGQHAVEVFKAVAVNGSRGASARAAGATRRLDAVNVRSILNSNQFQIVRRNGFPFRVLHFESRGFSGAFVQNLKTFLAAREKVTSSPLAQSNDDREQVSAFLG